MFLGQTESPILVSKYLKNMTESEIMLVLISGMGSMSATVLMGYSAMGIPMQYLINRWGISSSWKYSCIKTYVTRKSRFKVGCN